MPKVEFAPENRQTASYEYPKLSLDYGDTARINILQKDPHVEYVHTLRAPIIQNGKAVMETYKKRNGEEAERMKQEFISRTICAGDPDVLEEKGSDPAACPICRSASETDAVDYAEKRFGVHVLLYDTTDGFEVHDPFSAKLVVWTFGHRVFNKVLDSIDEWADPNAEGRKDAESYAKALRMHDLLLGPCENANFQKFDIRVARDAEWLKTEERKTFVAEVYKTKRTPHVDQLIARRNTVTQMQEDLDTVLLRYRQARGIGVDQQAVADTAANIDSLFDEVSTASAKEVTDAETPQADPAALTGLLDEDAPIDLVEAAKNVAPEPEGEKEKASFDELLADLGD